VLIGSCAYRRRTGRRCSICNATRLIAAGVERSHLYEDQASGKKDDRPGLEACLKALARG